jgi:DNA-binding CsgD family transcriptional regulator
MYRGGIMNLPRNPNGGSGSLSLTPRQREVVQLLAEGKSMKQAASVLHITPRTVAFHKYRVMEQLGLDNYADLIRYAVRRRIINLHDFGTPRRNSATSNVTTNQN